MGGIDTITDERDGLLRGVMRKFWGYDSFRPLQREAIECVMEGRDSIVVLPTGGGKSLCFQIPALTMEGVALVVSPLISLMKDQVDALTECGAPAGRLDSASTQTESAMTRQALRGGHLKLLYVSPERLMQPGFQEYLGGLNISFLAIDEAHCVSMWGHDFRPEYAMLGQLRERFPELAIHCYTATATPQVRRDIARQMQLRDAETLVGSFFRPNLNYSTARSDNGARQVTEVIDRNRGESGIVYCIRRKDVDSLTELLKERGYRAAAYHAGLEPDQRRQTQEDFIRDRVDIIVATVAFGMGIDKPNVRFVIHNGMPKSLEHYQQESGRGGRDGLPAECLLLWSARDKITWQWIIDNSENATEEQSAIGRAKLTQMANYCSGVTCRHRTLLSYFGQKLEREHCAACDVCLGNLELSPEAGVLAQKILSCVVRLREGFAGYYTAEVLRGAEKQKILDNGHDKLTTYGLMREFPLKTIREWIEQLAGQGALVVSGEYNQLSVTEYGWRILRGEATPKLLQAAARPARTKTATAEASWEGVNRYLFEDLRTLRKAIAEDKSVPPFVIFGDKALRAMAAVRPSSDEMFLRIPGVGERKNQQYGDDFTAAIRDFCRRNDVEMNVESSLAAHGGSARR